jgi:hypothetical protein
MFRCPDCGDEMPEKFERTHWAFCLLATRLIEPKVEALLFDLGLD